MYIKGLSLENMGLEIGMLVLRVLIKLSDFPLPNLVAFLKWLLNIAIQV